MIDYSAGLQFQCQNCGYCCRFEPGFVFLKSSDLLRLSKYFGVSPKKFIKSHCRSIHSGSDNLLSLKEKPNHDCFFWDQGCTIYKARPDQCRTYPFWPSVLKNQTSWEEEGKFCPGINEAKMNNKEFIDRCLADKMEELYKL